MRPNGRCLLGVVSFDDTLSPYAMLQNLNVNNMYHYFQWYCG
jgi:hypothetical protein